ncbi:MAG TPA: endonuclease MutS2 [Acidobacteriota bacterium]|jgi:DNA mismatch repair protein MutS2
MLDQETRQALEFNALLQLAATLAQTPLGARRIQSWDPLTAVEQIQCLQRRTSEAKQWVQQLRPTFAGLDDPASLLAGLAVEDLSLEPAQILLAARYLGKARELRQATKPHAALYPLLWSQLEAVVDFNDWIRLVEKSLDAEGRILDSASPEIRQIRVAIDHKRRHLHQALEQYFAYTEILQDAYITERSGRFVIPVRVERKNEIEGVLHGTSSSGATVFLEPLPVVGLNNDLAFLLEQEAVEARKILRSLTSPLRAFQNEFKATVEILTDLDATAARGRLSLQHQAVEPTFGNSGIRIKQGRHPILIQFLGFANVVPVDLELDPATRVLIISGPNAGGKTAVLKAIGLFSAMAQCGFHIPASNAALPLFTNVRADIGDHQSLQENLSTFSSHVLRLQQVLQQADDRALVLLDELGAGTDPSQGAALALAVLETLSDRGAHVVATTHLDRLKAFAEEQPFAQNAAVEFDQRSLKPTFRLLLGVSGQSNALSIAERLGLEKDIVERARRKMASQDREMEKYLQRLQDQSEALEQQKEKLLQENREMEQERSRFRMEKEQILRSEQEKLESRWQELQREFEGKLQNELQSVQDKAERERQMASHRRRMELLRQSFRKKASGSMTTKAAQDSPQALAPNSAVMVTSLGRLGTFLGMEGKQALVEIGGKRVQVALSDLQAAEKDKQADRRLPANVRFTPASETPVPQELNLIGKTVDEAIFEVDKFLDQAFVESYSKVRLIHGRGTGRLSKALRQFLKHHEHVADLRPGGEGEGGDAVTIVELR